MPGTEGAPLELEAVASLVLFPSESCLPSSVKVLLLSSNPTLFLPPVALTALNVRVGCCFAELEGGESAEPGKLLVAVGGALPSSAVGGVDSFLPEVMRGLGRGAGLVLGRPVHCPSRAVDLLPLPLTDSFRAFLSVVLTAVTAGSFPSKVLLWLQGARSDCAVVGVDVDVGASPLHACGSFFDLVAGFVFDLLSDFISCLFLSFFPLSLLSFFFNKST